MQTLAVCEIREGRQRYIERIVKRNDYPSPLVRRAKRSWGHTYYSWDGGQSWQRNSYEAFCDAHRAGRLEAAPEHH
jgi:hypothetical protein